jgi:hypothetical protein
MCGRNKRWKIGNKNIFFLYLPPLAMVRFFGSRIAVHMGIGHQIVLYQSIKKITQLKLKKEREVRHTHKNGIHLIALM